VGHAKAEAVAARERAKHGGLGSACA